MSSQLGNFQHRLRAGRFTLGFTRLLRCFISAMCFFEALVGHAQTSQTVSAPQANQISAPPQALTLNRLLESASASYPSILAARLEAQASSEDFAATERIRWPTLTATVESDSGNSRSAPSRAVQVDQTVWDAGRNTARISESKILADISLLKVYLQRQDVFLQIITAWQSMISSKERLNAAQDTLIRLKSYQAQMRRRVEAEASPRIDLELADSRLLQTEVELAVAQTSLQVAVTRLEQLSGEERLALRVPHAAYPLNLLETQQIIQGVIQRSQIVINLLIQVAWQKSEALASLYRRARKHNTLHRAALQGIHGSSHCQIGLSCARRTYTNGDVMAGDIVEVQGLVGTSGFEVCTARGQRRPVACLYSSIP